MTLDAQLTELLAARLCHDLGSPIATLSAIQGQTSQGASAILRETTDELTLRLRLFSNAFGLGDDADWSEIANLLRGAPMAHRVRFEVMEAPGEPPLRAGLVRLILVAALQAAEALPRGGAVHLAAEPGGPIAVWPEGRQAAWPSALLGLLAGGPLAEALAEGPHRVLSPWLLVLAAREGMSATLALGSSHAAAPLLLAPI